MRGLSGHSNARSYWTPVRGNRSRLLPPIKREGLEAYKKTGFAHSNARRSGFCQKSQRGEVISFAPSQ
jgi:hypothetical protein